jgi:uncharacterized membrane protein
MAIRAIIALLVAVDVTASAQTKKPYSVARAAERAAGQ